MELKTKRKIESLITLVKNFLTLCGFFWFLWLIAWLFIRPFEIYESIEPIGQWFINNSEMFRNYGLTLAGITAAILAVLRLNLIDRGQITDRFTNAIEHLGATQSSGTPNLEVRLGGIYTLERIAKDSENDHWPIMEILTAYVRKNASKNIFYPPSSDFNKTNSKVVNDQSFNGDSGQLQSGIEIGTDIQAILTVLFRRVPEREEDSIDLSNTNLTGANLSYCNLASANLSGAILSKVNLSHVNLNLTNLNDAKLEEVNLQNAKLKKADLSGATLIGVDLKGSTLDETKFCRANLNNVNFAHVIFIETDFTKSKLKGIKFNKCHLYGSNFYKCDLTEADFRSADLQYVCFDNANLRYADLSEANLTNAKFDGADLDETKFNGTNFSNTVMTNVINLSQYQLDKAYYDGSLNPPKFSNDIKVNVKIELTGESEVWRKPKG